MEPVTLGVDDAVILEEEPMLRSMRADPDLITVTMTQDPYRQIGKYMTLTVPESSRVDVWSTAKSLRRSWNCWSIKSFEAE